MEDLERKELVTFEIKDAEKGEVEAVFATINVVDKDEDVILDGAITDGAKAKLSSYDHDILTAGEAPVGVGTVAVVGQKAIFTGRYFLTTSRGREAFNTIKELGKDQEWSFGYRVLGAEIPDEAWRKKGARRMITKLNVFEVSPVIEGAGVGTRTVAAKAADDATKAEETRQSALAEEAAKVAARELEAKNAAASRAARLELEKLNRSLHRTRSKFPII